MSKEKLYTRKEVLAFGARVRSETRHPTTKTCRDCGGDGGGRDYCDTCQGTGKHVKSLEDLLDQSGQ